MLKAEEYIKLYEKNSKELIEQHITNMKQSFFKLWEKDEYKNAKVDIINSCSDIFYKFTCINEFVDNNIIEYTSTFLKAYGYKLIYTNTLEIRMMFKIYKN